MPIFVKKVENDENRQNLLIPVANVSRDWIVFEQSLVCQGLLGDREHQSRVSRNKYELATNEYGVKDQSLSQC